MKGDGAGEAQTQADAEADFETARIAALTARRDLLNRLRPDAERPEPGQLGLALSGGGIRSATLSLGALQAIAAHGRLLDFCYVSTVSGGGYAGTFLRSLFLPSVLRGSIRNAARQPEESQLDNNARFATEALKSRAFRTTLGEEGHDRFRNPVWWLREHSRYLAPAGATDYAVVVSYFIRNWLAMIYVFLLPVILFFLCVHSLMWRVADPRVVEMLRHTTEPFDKVGRLAGVWSPLLALPLFFLFLSVAAGLAYWLTEWLRRAGAPRRWPGRVHFLLSVAGSVATALVAAILWRHWMGPLAQLGDSFGGRLFALGLALLLASALLSLPVLFSVWQIDRPGFTAELRRRLTNLSTHLNQCLLVTLALALVDSGALWLMTAGRQWWHVEGWTGAFSVLLLPLSAWAIARVAQGTSGGNRVLGWIAAHVPVAALILGILLFGLLAVIADAMVIGLLGVAGEGAVIHSPQWHMAITWLVIASLLTLVTGSSTGFINLSSLHNFYASRLGRAYLGGSNRERLRLGLTDQSAKPVTETHPLDDIDAETYFSALSLAPLHLVNVTLNETRNRDGNQIVQRDRKGVPMVFGPEEIVVDGAHGGADGHDRGYWHDWEKMRGAKVEMLSAAQLCAISGAAASTGMGEKSSLGTSLTLGFANVRLGYWWDARDMLRRVPGWADQPFRLIWQWATQPFRTYFYLGCELTGRYSRDYRRLNLSDGGHFENSGAYELLRRGVKAILVLDNGADPDYRFDDLENLIRKARLDLGLSVNVAEPEDVRQLLGEAALHLFLNGRECDWRARAAARVIDPKSGKGGAEQQEDAAFALLLHVYDTRRPIDPDSPHMRIIWVKPRRKADIPQDLVGYGLANPAFPQQSTGDQFYDERQWESYRGLGYCLMDALFDRTDKGADVLRTLARA